MTGVGWSTRHAVLPLLAARVASSTAYGFFFVASSWLILGLHGNVMDLASVLALSMIPSVVVSLMGGVLVDRLDRLRLAQCMDGARAAVIGSLALLAWTDALQLPHLYVGAFAVGVANSLAMPAYSALLPEVIGRDDLVRANGLWQVATQIGALTGASLGGLLLAALSAPSVALWADAATYLTAALVLGLVRRRTTAHLGSLAGFSLRRDLSEGLRVLVADPVLLAVGLLSVLPLAYIGVVAVLEAPFARDVLDVGAAGFGLLDAIFGIGSLLGGAISMRLLVGRGLAPYSYVLLAIGALTAVLSVVPELYTALATHLALGISVACGNVLYPAFVQSRTPGSHLGRVVGALQSVGALVQLVMILGAGFIASAYSPRVAFGGTGLLFLAAGALAWVVLQVGGRALTRPSATGLTYEAVG